ncbi:type II secretion system protein GspM [Motiliproteus sp. SC1-56]|uniref:type II secretion system protein GspM n=1 Tax=Motiliproteus sp. SC1-56 TaxID=2799565 RepID=UPI001A9059A5|nr:type II secretion system protein M [Motiliproteus sp. SC1-56]
MLSARYQRLSSREKLLLWLGGITAALLLGYLLIWRPLSVQNQQLHQQVAEKQALLGWMQSAAAEVKQLRQHTSVSNTAGMPVQQLITRHAARLKLKPERMQSRSDLEADLWLDGAAFNSIMALVEALSRDGVAVEKANLRATSKAGQVDAHLVFSR